MSQSKLNINNKKAYHEYEILDKYVAGIMLSGTEIKSIRQNKASIKEAYCVIVNNEVFIRNMFINEYENGSYNNHNPKRDRKLLLNRIEINKLNKAIQQKGNTIIPLHLFLNNKNLVKIEIALTKGKKLHDKRLDMKEKDTKREMDRIKKEF